MLLNDQEITLSIAGFILGIIAFFWMFIALIPFLGWLNWINIPFSIIGLILSILGYSQRRQQVLGLIGIVLCGIAITVGVLRLNLGGGIF